jgi:hypothetical protein
VAYWLLHVREEDELVLRRLLGIDKLELSAPNEITIVVNATGKVVVKKAIRVW